MKEVSAPANSFQEFAEVHESFQRLLLEYQVAIVEGDAGVARERLDAFRAALDTHIQAEEEVLLPVYAARVQAPRGGSEALLRKEHAKLRMLAEVAGRQLQEESCNGAVSPRSAVDLLEGLHVLKHLLEHHDLRERDAFFPGLEEATDERERQALLSRCHEIHRSAGLA